MANMAHAAWSKAMVFASRWFSVVGAGAKLPQISRSQNAHGLRVGAR
jgi:hypothetical protein